MLSNTITVEVTCNDSVLKTIDQEKPINTSLSSVLGVVQTDVNDFLTYLVNKSGGDIEEIPDSGSSDDSENEYDESHEEKKRSVKGTEENSNHNKKIKT